MLVVLLFLVTLANAKMFAIRLAPSEDPIEYALRYGLQYVTSTVNEWHVYKSHSTITGHVFLQDASVLEYEVQKERQQYKRTDPLYNLQWHLHYSEHAVDTDGETAVNYSGKGITVAIVDDGLQHTHPDLTPHYNPLLSYDFNDRDMDPAPNVYQNDGHGTSAAGVCCAARDNNHCGRGAAPEANLVGIRLIARGTYDYEEAEGLSHKLDHIRIHSCSWGPEDSGKDMVAPGRVTQDALSRNFANNAIYIWAGGNGRHNGDNGNYDGYANHYATIAIGAIDYNGQQSWYSESCACLMATAPSSGYPGRGIVTVDLLGPYGYSSGECTKTFGGTSSAAPLAAGIVALLLEKRPELTNRDIMHIIAKGSTVTPTMYNAVSDWTPQTHHSHHYGFGLLKVPLLLDTGDHHQLVPPMKTVSSPVLRPNMVIAANSRVEISLQSNLNFVEQVLVDVKYTHRYRGHVEIELEHDGITSILAEKREDYHSGSHSWTFSSVRHWGQRSNGPWFLRMKDTTNSGGRLVTVSIKVLGY